MELSDRPLYLAAYVIGGVSTVVGIVSIVSEVGASGVPGGGSAITLLVGISILALAVTGPSDGSGPADDASGEATATTGTESADEEAP